MTHDAPSPHRPISSVRITTVALIGVVTAVSVPAVAAAIAVSSPVTDESASVPIAATGPITRVVVLDSESDLTITGDLSATGASGQAEIQWKGEHGPRPVLRQSVADGVLTLSKDCSCGGCGPVDIRLRVPRDVSVRAVTSDGRIQVMDVTGGVDLVSSNGDLEGFGLGAGPASFRTTNGSVHAAFDGAAPSIRLQTTNGDADLVTDGRTAYNTTVNSTGDELKDVENIRDRLSPNVIVVSTTNGKVSVK
ncbi:MAG: hypothetical protein HOV87_19275 [Catenulispora sp.]|nr:hypothetical protein [Catenulispora sp.]